MRIWASSILVEANNFFTPSEKPQVILPLPDEKHSLASAWISYNTALHVKELFLYRTENTVRRTTKDPHWEWGGVGWRTVGSPIIGVARS